MLLLDINKYKNININKNIKNKNYYKILTNFYKNSYFFL